MKTPTQLLETALLILAFFSIHMLNAQDKLSVIIDQHRSNLLVQETGKIAKDQEINYEELLVTYDSITNKEYEIGLPFTIIDDFIKGLKSPHNTDRWMYASRKNRKIPTDLYFYNRSTKKQKLLVAHQDTPDPTLSFVPFAFSSNPDIIYVEAEDYIKGGYHLGIWEVNLVTKTFVKLNMPSAYMMTPLINSSRDKFYFTSTSESNRDIVHGITDLLMTYDLNTDEINLVKDNSRESITLEGFSTRQLKNEDLPNVIPDCQAEWSPPNFDELPTIFFRIPYATGYSYCTGRLGNIAPCDSGFAGNSCQSGTECIHGNDPVAGPCVATGNTTKYLAVDLTSSGHSEYKIYASARGKVTYAAWMNGYGYSVEIEHPNGLFTWYAHMREQPDVVLDQEVCSNTILGTEGSTGNSTGPHLHFEIRTASLCKGTEYVPFVDSGFNVLNFGDNGIVKEKANCGPLITFVSNQDFEPNCAGVQLSLSGNILEVSDLAVANHGDENSEPFKIKYFLVEGELEYYLGFQQMSGILNSNTALMPDVSFNVSAVPTGNYNLRVKIEANSLLTSPYPLLVEYNLTNNDCTSLGSVSVGSAATCFDGIRNQGELGIDCGGPCLACSPQINLTSTACATPIVNGDLLTVLYEITNLGSQASGDFYVDFYLYKTGNSFPIDANMLTYHPSINGSSSQTFSKTVNLSTIMPAAGQTDGEFRISLFVDTYDQITETDENDNFCINHITKINYSTINLKNASYCAVNQVVNGELQITHAIVNQGSQATGIVNYQIYAHDDASNQNYPLGPTYSVLSVPGNTTTTLYAYFDLETEMEAHGLPAGQYKIAIHVDHNEYVFESNELDNNCLSSSTFEYAGRCSVDNGYIEGYYSGNFDFRAPSFLISPNAGNQCIIPNGSSVLISAGEFVELKAGFDARPGSVFTALIDDCANLYGLIGNDQSKLSNQLNTKTNESVATGLELLKEK